MLFSEEEIRKQDIKKQIRLWKKELKNKNSKYSDCFIYRQIKEYENELKGE